MIRKALFIATVIAIVVFIILYVLALFLDFCKWNCKMADEKKKERNNKTYEGKGISTNHSDCGSNRSHYVVYYTR